MDKENVVYIYNGMLFNHEKEGKTAIVTTWMDLEDIILSERSQTEKDKYYMVSFTCEILKSQTHRNQ